MPTAIVLGGGIAGLAAAIGLRDAGYRVAVYEQAEVIEPLGAAISVWPNAVAALRGLGALELIEREAAPLTSMLLATREGAPLIGPWRVGPPRHGDRAYLPTRVLVHRALMDALGPGVPIHLGRRATSVEDQGERVVVAIEGDTLCADLVIAADGIWSATGTAVTGGTARPRGYGGVLALSDPVDATASYGAAAEYWGQGERFGVCDLGRSRRYWFYMADEPLPPLDRNALLAKARDGWPASIVEAIAATPAERLIPVSIAARPVPRRLARGRIICVGDAGHAMEPNLGQGACQALEDAAALAALAKRLPPGKLAATFDTARRDRVAGMMRRSREGGLAVHGRPAVRGVMRTAMRLTPAFAQRRLVDGFYRLPAY